MNKLKLRFLFEYADGGKDQSLVTLHALLTVDGRRLSNEETDILHLDELVGSIYGYGPFEIYTCGCGIAPCAGIWEDITVDQVDGNVLWTVPNPLKTPKEGSTTYDHFVFDRQLYRQAIRDGLEAAKTIILQHDGSVSVGPHGFTAEQLLQLTTVEPDEVIDRRPRPRQAEVCHGPVFVENRYICRVVEEEIAGRGVHTWVEGWTGSRWSRNMEPNMPMNTVIAALPASAAIMAEAGVPDEPFPPGYELPPLGNNRYGVA